MTMPPTVIDAGRLELLANLEVTSNRSLLPSLVASFVERSRQAVARCATTLSLEEQGQLAHQLRGMALNLGASRMAELAAHIENNARNGQLLGPHDVAALAGEVDAAIAALEHWLGNRGERPAVEPEPKPVGSEERRED